MYPIAITKTFHIWTSELNSGTTFIIIYINVGNSLWIPFGYGNVRDNNNLGCIIDLDNFEPIKAYLGKFV